MAGYDVQQRDDTTEFSVVPEQVPYPLPVIVPLGLLILLVCSVSLILGLLLGVAGYFGVRWFMGTKTFTQYRAPARFSVSPRGIDAAGKTIPKDAIHRLIIQNHILHRFEGVSVIAGALPGQTMGEASNKDGMMFALKKLGPISYRVDAEVRGNPTTLAGGLTEPTAAALLADITRALQPSPLPQRV